MYAQRSRFMSLNIRSRIRKSRLSTRKQITLEAENFTTLTIEENFMRPLIGAVYLMNFATDVSYLP